jgi:four helix bundle protein
MNEEELKLRTKQFALRTVKLVEALPSTPTARTIGLQLLRSGLSVGANYRAACRGKSRPDFASKLAIALEEADECSYWMELLVEARILPAEKLTELRKEADELVAILTASIRTVRAHKGQ